jgi:hypothetical protein
MAFSWTAATVYSNAHERLRSPVPPSRTAGGWNDESMREADAQLRMRVNAFGPGHNGMFMPDMASNSQALSHRCTCLRTEEIGLLLR